MITNVSTTSIQGGKTFQHNNLYTLLSMNVKVMVKHIANLFVPIGVGQGYDVNQ